MRKAMLALVAITTLGPFIPLGFTTSTSGALSQVLAQSGSTLNSAPVVSSMHDVAVSAKHWSALHRDDNLAALGYSVILPANALDMVAQVFALVLTTPQMIGDATAALAN